MNKREYMQPEMEVIVAETECSLLETSNLEWYDETGDDVQF